MRSLLIVLFILLNLPLWSQGLVYENHIYRPDIRTVILSKNVEVYDPVPVIKLNSTDQLRLVFDQLGAQNEFYNYGFVHCDANWNPSNMSSSELQSLVTRWGDHQF